MDPERWAALKDEHQLHSDPPISFFAHDRAESEGDRIETDRFEALLVEKRRQVATTAPKAEGHSDGATLEEIGRVLGLTRERVRQIEAIAIRKFQRSLRLQGFDAYDLCPEDRGSPILH